MASGSETVTPTIKKTCSFAYMTSSPLHGEAAELDTNFSAVTVQQRAP